MFKFNLQRVLDIRAAQERLKQNELALERKKETEILQKISRLRDEQAGEYKEGRALWTAAASDIRVFRAHQRYMEALELSIVRSYRDLETQRLAVEAARLALIEAARKRKLLEKLKDKRLAVFKKEEEAAEQKIIDEIGGTRSARRITGTQAGGRPIP